MNQASGSSLSYQLYTALGIGIGVSRTATPIGDVTLQLWLIPSQERFVGMTRGLMRGARSSIVVLREESLGALRQLILDLAPEQRDSLMVVVVGSVLNRDEVRCSIDEVLHEAFELHRAHSVQETLKLMSGAMIERLSGKPHPVLVMLLHERHCPQFQFQPSQATLPLNTEDEIEEIRRLASSLGLTVSDTACIIDLEEGIAELELATGALAFQSKLCEECKKSCKREARICIVGQDKGWSSDSLDTRALLTMAKLEALTRGEIPADIRLQMNRATRCSSFVPNGSSVVKGHSFRRQGSDQVRAQGRGSLLEEANRRVKDGRLSASVYRMLKSKLQGAENQCDRTEGAEGRCR